MSNFPQDVYAHNLLSYRRYPLWTPEPHIELPESYQQEGLKIGDVGVVVPEDGSFDVFFNISLPRDHPLHALEGVPDNFTQVKLKREDYRIAPDAECPGRVISSSSVDCKISRVDPFDLNGRTCSLTNYQFSLYKNEGAMLILPEGAQRHRLAKELLLLDVVIQHAVDWYRFAREQLYRDIRNDSLYLITGFHKASSWSLASFMNTGASSALCKLVQSTNGGLLVATNSTWETIRPLEWRIGPRRNIGLLPNQSVFITGFKVAVNEELLHLKRVTVKVEHSNRMLASRLVGFGAGLANFFVGGIQSPAVPTRHDEAGDTSTTEHDMPPDEREQVTVERVPHVSQPFHPSDVINRYLLTKEPSAKIAVTHDSQWIALLEKGILRQDELRQEGRLTQVVSREYHIVTKGGAVYLQNIGQIGPSSPQLTDTYATAGSSPCLDPLLPHSSGAPSFESTDSVASTEVPFSSSNERDVLEPEESEEIVHLDDEDYEDFNDDDDEYDYEEHDDDDDDDEYDYEEHDDDDDDNEYDYEEHDDDDDEDDQLLDLIEEDYDQPLSELLHKTFRPQIEGSSSRASSDLDKFVADIKSSYKPSSASSSSDPVAQTTTSMKTLLSLVGDKSDSSQQARKKERKPASNLRDMLGSSERSRMSVSDDKGPERNRLQTLRKLRRQISPIGRYNRRNWRDDKGKRIAYERDRPPEGVEERGKEVGGEWTQYESKT